jgi:hypothetical protein
MICLVSCIRRRAFVYECLVLYCGLFLALMPALASAQNKEDLSCLFRTNGRVIRWDKFWQRDNQDDGVQYRVTAVEESIARNQPRQVKIKLVAVGPAQEKERTANIILEHAARMFCERVIGGLEDKSRGVVLAVGGREASKARPTSLSSICPSREVTPDDLMFRVLQNGEWVPAKPGAGDELFVCLTPAGARACNRRDYQRLLESYQREGRKPDPRYIMIVPNPFIRHTAEGWQRVEPIGLPIDALVADCEVADRKFSCLVSEKQEYSGDLVKLGREIELENKLFPKPASPAKVPVQNKNTNIRGKN